jgi:DNA-binding LytR/AlgR family response regulator
MNRGLNQLIILFKENFGLFLSICFGLFLFVLFFQPFPLDHFDFNDRLLFVAGLSGIVFLFMVLIRIPFLHIVNKYNQNTQEASFLFYLSGFLILALSSVAFAFYLHYVGFVGITFFIMSKVVLICLVPPVTTGLYDLINELRQINESLVKEKETAQKQVEKYEEDNLNKSIEFISENNSESLSLLVSDVAVIKSADNYVEIVFKEEGHFKKKLIRNTIKNIEHQLKSIPDFIRCHRICIVNIRYIEKLHRNYNGHWLTIKGYDEQIPVSRQYLLKFKEIN